MSSEDWRVRHLESGPAGSEANDRLDLIREILADPATWTDPPSRVIEQVSAEIGAGTDLITPSSGRRRWMAASIAALVLLVVALGVAGLIDRPSDTVAIQASMVGTELAPEAHGTASLEETPSGWWIRLVVEGLPPAPEGSYYQGWVWRQGEGVSIGTFHLRGGSDPVILWSGVDVADYPSVWVTLEEEGAGPAASDEVMLRGDVTGLTP
jgi:Anti-sigma-K factor rskA